MFPRLGVQYLLTLHLLMIICQGSSRLIVQYLPCHCRALFDRLPHAKDELSFKKNDILYVTDTMHQGHIGCWKAWRISEDDAQKRENGKVPSRMKYVMSGLQSPLKSFLCFMT